MSIRPQRNTRGFSLIELLVVVAILMLVLGVVFQHVATVQRRYRQEEARTDMFQQAREAMDSLARDLHEAGYPNYRQFSPQAYGYPVGQNVTDPNQAQVRNSIRNAVGLASLTANEIIFEGDVDQDGQVDSVRYRLVAGPLANFECPCLQRSQLPKVAVDPLAQPGTNYMVVVENVTGFTYTAYNDTGVVISSTAPGVVAGVPNTNQTSLDSIATLEVRLNVQGGNIEFDTNRRAESSFVVSSRLAN
jgi:prepilin-type N-terminal cleavage/methylation domain-containing protein